MIGSQHFKNTAQIFKLSIKDFFSKCDQIRRKLRIWSHLPKKSLMRNFIFCGVEILNKVTIHHRILQVLGTELYKVHHGFST